MSDYNNDLKKTVDKRTRKFLDDEYKNIFKMHNLGILNIRPVEITEMDNKTPKQYEGIDLYIKYLDKNNQTICLTAEEKIRWIKDIYSNDPYIDLEIHHDIRNQREGYMKDIKSDIIIFVLMKDDKLELLKSDSVYIYKTSELKKWYQNLKCEGNLTALLTDLSKYLGRSSNVRYIDNLNHSFELWINKPTYINGKIRNISSYIRIPPDYEGWKAFKFF